MKQKNNIKAVTPKNMAAWRAWLQKNHLRESKVILIKYKKHTGRPIINSAEAMREAICFGWIDTTAHRIDDNKYAIIYSRRNKNSRWSYNTLRYARELIKEGKMSEFGLKMYKEGLRKKPHDHGIPKNPYMPLELKEYLAKHPKQKSLFDNLPPSRKRMHYRAILRAKQPQTKRKRVEQAVKGQ